MHNSRGEMFSPMFLENKLKFSPYIKEAVIFGDQRDFVACLINIDPIVVGKWAEDRGHLLYTPTWIFPTNPKWPTCSKRWPTSTPGRKRTISKSNALPCCTSCWTWTTAN
jgi:hypothetical protein